MSAYLKTVKGVTTIMGDTSIRTKKFGAIRANVVLVTKLSGNKIKTVTSLKMGCKKLATVTTIFINGKIVSQKACFGKGLLPGIRTVNLKQTTKNNKTIISGLVNGERIKPFTSKASGCKCGCGCGLTTIQLQNGTKLQFTIDEQMDKAFKLLFAKFDVEVTAAIRKKIGSVNDACQENCFRIERICNDNCFLDSICAPACAIARNVCLLQCLI